MVAAGSIRVNSAGAVAGIDSRQAAGLAGHAARALALRPLFAPLAALLDALPIDACAELDGLNSLLAAIDPRPRTREGRPIRFVRPDASPLRYEERVRASGEVVTRPANWHDFFNALVWMRFSRTKAELNALHLDEMRSERSGTGRGPLRDAATQFDESGIVVLASDPSLFELLEQRRWHELFWTRRTEVVSSLRFLVFGHGLYDALRAPFYRICGRAALIAAAPTIIAADVATQCRHADTVLAARFAARTCYPRPKSLLALPLLGIPGVCPQNERAEYYADTVQFRPPPSG